MTMHRISGQYEFECDRCNVEAFSSGTANFNEAVNRLKEEGWIIYRDDWSVWRHNCPYCAKIHETT